MSFNNSYTSNAGGNIPPHIVSQSPSRNPKAPNFPRPSPNSANALRSRLVLGKKKKPSYLGGGNLEAGESFDDPRGFGEDEFDSSILEDSTYENNASFFNQQLNSSIVTTSQRVANNTLPLNNTSISSTLTSKSTYRFKNTALNQGSVLDNSVMEASIIKYPHASIHEAIESEGHTVVAHNIANGITEFGYLQSVDNSNMALSFTDVPYANKNKGSDFYTLSRYGILNHKEGEMQSLIDYMQNKQTFEQVKDINIIKFYKKYKFFLLWKSNLVGKKKSRAFGALKVMWCCDPILWQVYSIISDKLMELSQLTLLKIDVDKFYDTESFSSLQKSLQTKSKQTRKEILSFIVQSIVSAGEKFIDSKIHGMPLLYQKLGEMTTDISTIGSISSANPLGSRIISFTEKGAIRTASRKLSEFVKVIDFLIRDAAYNCVVKYLESFLMTCDRPERKLYYEKYPSHIYHTVTEKAPVNPKGVKSYHGIMKFQVVLEDDTTVHDNNPDKHSIVMIPSRNDVMIELTNILHNTLLCGVYTESILFQQSCRGLFQPISGELEGFLLNDKIFIDKENSVHLLTKTLLDFFASDFDSASRVLGQYSQVCTITFNNNIFMKNLVGNIRLKTSEYRTELDRLNEEMTFVESIPTTIDVGVLRLDLVTMKNSIFETVIRARATLNRNIPNVFLESSEKLYIELSGIKGALSSKTIDTNLDEFIRVVDIYQAALRNAEITKTEYEYILSIKDIIDLYNINKVEAVTSQYNALLSFWFSYNEALSSFTESVDAKSKEHHHEMNVRVKALSEPCDNSRNFIASEKINNVDSDPEVVLKEFATLKRTMNAVKTKMAVLDRYQDVLKFKFFNYTPVLELIDSLEYCNSLWEMIFNIKELFESLYVSNFVDVKLQDYEKKIVGLVKSFHQAVQPEGGILVDWIRSEIDRLTTFVPILQNLLSPILRPQHKVRVVEALNRDIYEEENFLIKYLVDLNCFQLKDVLREIFNDATMEANIETTLKQLKDVAMNLEYSIDTDRENKTVYIVTNIDSIKASLEDIELSLISSAKSVYSAGYSDSINEFLDEIKLWQKTSENMALLQESYLRARVLFTSARTARYLSSGAKNFKVIDDAWRFVSRTVKQLGLLSETIAVEGFIKMTEDALPAMDKIDNQLRDYISEQRESFPKLYLLDRSLLIDIFCTFDPRKTFYKCNAILPYLTDIGFDINDAFSTISLSSGFEKVDFLKSVSARSSLTDWIRSIEMALSDRISNDIRDLLYDPHVLLGDFANSKLLNQARICYLQIKFWSSLLERIQNKDGLAIHNYKGEDSKSLKQECLQEIQAIHKIMVPLTAPYHVISASNMLIQCLYHRDLLEKVFDETDTNPIHSFTLDSLTIKIWNPSNSSIRIKQLEFTQAYGMKYQNFGSRLVITPLTERFFLAINSAFLNFSAPCIFGDKRGGKQASIKALAYDYGMEICSFSVLSLTKDTIIDLMKVSMGSGMWMMFSDIGKVDNNLLSFLLTSLSISLNVLRSKVQSYSLFGHTVRSLKSDKFQAKFVLLFDGSFNLFKNYPCFLGSLQNQFRPISFLQVDAIVVITTLLIVYDYQSHANLAIRLDALNQHMAGWGIISPLHCTHLLYNAIKEIGMKMKTEGSNRSRKQNSQRYLGLIVREMLLRLPKHIIEQFSINSNQIIEICVEKKSSLETHLNPSESDRFLKCIDLFTDSDKDTFDNLSIVANSVFLAENARAHSADQKPLGDVSNAIENFDFDASHNSIINPTEELLMSAICVEPLPINGFKNPVSVIVVGNRGAGKSSIIDKVLGSAKSCYDDKTQRLNEANKVPIVYKQFLVHPRVIFPSSFMDSYKDASIYFGNVLNSLTPNEISVVKFDLLEISGGLSLSLFQQQARMTSRSVSAVWECLSLKNSDPVTIVENKIVYVTASYDGGKELKASLASRIEEICLRDGYPLHKVINHCMDSFFSRFLKFSSSQNNFPVDIIAHNCLNIFQLVYESSGLTPTLGEKSSKWNEECVRRIFIFACIWSFGVSPNLNRAAFKSWFLSKEGFDTELKASNSAFPIVTSEVSIYDSSILYRPERDENILSWKSRGAIEAVRNTSPSWFNDCHLALYADYYASHDRVIAPIAEFQGISFIRDCYAGFENLTNVSNMVCGGFSIVGERGSSKTSLLHYLLNKTAEPRWILSATCKDRRSFEKGIQTSINRALPRLCENNVNNEGCLFVDDISIPYPNESCSSGFEYLRELLSNKNKSVYNSSSSKFDNFSTMQAFMAVNSTYSKDREDSQNYERFVKHSLIFSLRTDEVSISSIFACVLVGKYPWLDASLVSDITNLSTNILSTLTKDAKLFKLVSENCNPSIFGLKYNGYIHLLSQILGNFSSALLNLSSANPGDIIRIWDRCFGNFMVTSNSLATSIMGIASNIFADPNPLVPFKTSIFVAAADREIQKYSGDVETSDSSVYNMQYSKSGGDFDVNIYSLDYLRETVMITTKKNSALYVALAAKIDCDSDFFWEDSLMLVSVILTKTLSSNVANAIVATDNHDILRFQLELLSNSFNFSYYCATIKSVNLLRSSIKDRFMSYVMSQPEVLEFLAENDIKTSFQYEKIGSQELDQLRHVFYFEVLNVEQFITVKSFSAEFDSIMNLNNNNVIDCVDSFDLGEEKKYLLLNILIKAFEKVKEKISLLVSFASRKTAEAFGLHYLVNTTINSSRPLKFLSLKNVYMKSFYRFTKLVGENPYKRVCDVVDVASDLFIQFAGRAPNDNSVSPDYREQTINAVFYYYKIFESLHRIEDAKAKFVEVVKGLVPEEELADQSIWPTVITTRGQANIPLLVYAIACAIYGRYFYISENSSSHFHTFMNSVMGKCQEFFATSFSPSLLLSIQRGIVNILSNYGSRFELTECTFKCLVDMHHMFKFIDPAAMVSHFLTSFMLAAFIGNINLTDDSLVTTLILRDLFRNNAPLLDLEMGGYSTSFTFIKSNNTLPFNTTTNFHCISQSILPSELLSLHLLLSGFACNFPLLWSKLEIVALWNVKDIKSGSSFRSDESAPGYLLRFSLFDDSRIEKSSKNISSLVSIPETSEVEFYDTLRDLVDAIEPSLLSLAVLLKSVQSSSSSSSSMLSLLWSSFISGMKKLFVLVDAELLGQESELAKLRFKDIIGNSFNFVLQLVSSFFPHFTYSSIVVESVFRFQLDQSAESRLLLKGILNDIYTNAGRRGILEIPKGKIESSGESFLKETEEDDDEDDENGGGGSSVRIMLSETSRTSIRHLLHLLESHASFKSTLNPVLSESLTSNPPIMILGKLDGNLQTLADWISDKSSMYPSKLQMTPLETLIVYIQLKPTAALQYAQTMFKSVVGTINHLPQLIDALLQEFVLPKSAPQGSANFNKNSSISLYSEMNSSNYTINLFSDFFRGESADSIDEILAGIKSNKFSHDERIKDVENFSNKKVVVMQSTLSRGTTLSYNRFNSNLVLSGLDSQSDQHYQVISLVQGYANESQKHFIASGFSLGEGFGTKVDCIYSMVAKYFSNCFDSYYSPLLCRVSWLMIFSHVAVVYRLSEHCNLSDLTVILSLKTVKNMILSKIKEIDMSNDVSEMISPEFLVDTISYSFYLYSCQSDYSNMIRSIFSYYFTPTCLNLKKEYKVGGKYPVPKSFREIEVVQTFVATIEHASRKDSHFVADMCGLSGSIINSNLYKGLNYEHCRTLFYKPLISWICESQSGPQPLAGIVDSVCSKLQSLIALLPQSVVIDAKTIRAYSQEFMSDQSSKKTAKKKAKSQSSANKLKEINPIIEYLITESFEFNSMLAKLKADLKKFSDAVVLYNHLYKLICKNEKSLLSVLHWCNEISKNSLILAGDLWQTCLFSGCFVEDLNCVNVKFDHWMIMLAEKSKMLTFWLQEGYPSALRLHLFSNPMGLLHSFKESYAMQSGSSIDKLQFDATLVDPKMLGEVDFKHFNGLNYGCNIIITDIILRNGIFDHSNYQLSFPVHLNSSEHTQNIAMQLALTPESTNEILEEDYSCPFYVCSNIPSNVFEANIADQQIKRSITRNIMSIHIPTTEVTGDLEMRGVLLLSSPRWFSSVNVSEL